MTSLEAIIAGSRLASRRLSWPTPLSSILPYPVFHPVGWKVVTVDTGLKALDAFEVGRFEIVITDMNLGDGMSGLELAQKLRRQEPDFNIVIASGSD